MSTYKQVGTGTLKQEYVYLYGSTRTGEYLLNRDSATLWNRHYYRVKGNRHYELTNHLGNVLAVVTDRKIAKDTTADLIYTPQFFMPDVYSVQNYYAFGQSMPKWSTTAAVNDPKKYRFGYNGKEDDDEWGKQDYGFRISDPRIGRFLSVDPLAWGFPWYTPYQFAGNKPIWAIDLDGLEEATSQQIEAAKKYHTETELSQSEYFSNIAPQIIRQQTLARLNSLGDDIKQGDFQLCGPAAACHIAASHNPENYVKTVFDLYMNGGANNGNISSNEDIKNGKPDGSGNIDGIPAVDWILLHSLRKSENILPGYDPHEKKDWSKKTLVGEFEDLLERLNIDVKVADEGVFDDKKWLSTEMIPWLDSGKRAVFFVDSRQYSPGTYEDEISQWVSQNYGRHFIVVKGIKLDADDRVHIIYWDNGSEKTKRFQNFNVFSKANMYTWSIEQANTSKEEKK